MNSNGKLLRWDEAGTIINSIADPIQRRLVNRAVNSIMNKFRAGALAPGVDLDMKFFVESITELFANLEIIRKELAGERPGAWSDSDDE